MAVTNLTTMETGVVNHPKMMGTGSLTVASPLCTDTTTYPIGSTYLDVTNKVLYTRIAVAGVVADWYTLTMTVAS